MKMMLLRLLKSMQNREKRMIKHVELVEIKKKPEREGHWVDNNKDAITCSSCHTWFNKDDRYSYMRFCPYCNAKMKESEGKKG